MFKASPTSVQSYHLMDHSATPPDHPFAATESQPEHQTANQAQKRTRKRVRTGCITCRVRRVKCDETKPHCNKCTSTGRKCDGFDAPLVSRNELALAIRRGEPLNSLQYGSSTFASSEERQSFEFFRLHTSVAGQTNILDWGFWDQIVLQFVHSESAIKHGVLALSALHRNYVRGHEAYSPSTPSYFNDVKTLRWYSKAVEEMKALFEAIDTDPAARQKVIAASIIFICIENILGEPKVARMHLQNALRIDKEDRARRSTKSKVHSREGVVSQALGRIDFGAITLSSSEAPYPWNDDGNIGAHAVRIPLSFNSLHQSEMWLFALLKDMFSFGRSLFNVGSAFEMLGKITRAATWYVQQMTNWKLAFEPLAVHLERLDETTRNRCLLLRVYHRLGFMLSSAGYMPTEMSWDACDEQFTEMLDWIEVLPSMAHERTVFSLEPGVLVPLFLAATRCRHPVIRRRALALMTKQRRKEMIWESHGAACVAKWLIDLEESGLHPKTEDGRPHEKDRFRVVDVDIPLKASHVDVKAFLSSYDDSDKLRTVQETLKVCRGLGSQNECICGQFHLTESYAQSHSTRNEREFEREMFDSERLGNARGWVPYGCVNMTKDAEIPNHHPFAADGLTAVNERTLRSDHSDPYVDDVLQRLQRLDWAHRAVGERHIAMMKWSSEKYEYEKSKAADGIK